MYDTFSIRSLRALRWLVYVVLGLVVVSSTAVGQTCYEYQAQKAEFPSQFTAWLPSQSAACSAAASEPSPVFPCSGGTWQRTYTSSGFTPSGAVPSGGLCTFQQTNTQVSGSCSLPGPSTFDRAYSVRTAVACPEPEECSGLASEGVGDQFTSLHYPGADGYCNPISNCKMSVDSSVEADGTTIYKVLHTAQSCAVGALPPVGDQAKDGETCGGSNPEFCLAKAGENCGYVNDSFVCLPKVGETKCAVFGDGGRVCGNRAPTPPVPDNGTPGTAATPAATVTSTVNNVSTTFNYFNATQVAGSSRDPGSSGEDPYGEDGGDGGDCDPATEECGEGSVTGGEFCSAEPVCTGDAIQCAIVEQQWRNRCVAPLTAEEKTAMFAGLPNDDIDGDGSSEGIAEGMPGSSSEPIDILSDFDSDGWLGGRTCPAIYNVDLPAAFGGVINISLADACFFFQLIGSIVLVMAWFEAAKIVVTGFF